MEHVLALEIWMASLAVAGAVGWIIGERQSQTPLDVMSLAAEEEREGLFTMTIPALASREGSRAAHGAPRLGSGSRISESRHRFEPCSRAPLPARRATVFASMPPIAELEAQIRSIRQADNIWQSPLLGECLAEFMANADLGSLEVLTQYRSAIAELKAGATSRENGPIEPAHEIVDAEPIDVDAFFAGLERHLEAHGRSDGLGERLAEKRLAGENLLAGDLPRPAPVPVGQG